MVKFKIVVLYPRLVLTLLLSAVKIISKSTITRLHHERQLKIQLHRPLGECNLKEFINITSSCKSLKAFIRFVVYYITEKIPNVRALIGTAVSAKRNLTCPPPITMKKKIVSHMITKLT